MHQHDPAIKAFYLSPEQCELYLDGTRRNRAGYERDSQKVRVYTAEWGSEDENESSIVPETTPPFLGAQARAGV